MDFWKGMLCAQAFICFVYLLFGAFVYAEWGQYAIFNITTVVTPYSLQTAANVLSLLTGWFAVCKLIKLPIYAIGPNNVSSPLLQRRYEDSIPRGFYGNIPLAGH